MLLHDDEKKLLKKVKGGTSMFRCIPEDIGEVVFCATSNYMKRPRDKKSQMIILAFSILVPSLLIFFFHHYIWVVILSLLAAWVGIDGALFFRGTDYFVGTEGFAVIEFKNQRDNIVSKQMVLWSEVEDVIATETRKVTRHGGEKLIYSIRVNGHERVEENKRKLLGKLNDDYSDGKLGSLLNYEIRFWKAVEEQWIERIWPEMKARYDAGEELTFNLYLMGRCVDGYIRLQGRNMVVGNRTIPWSDIQSTEVDEQKITIYHMNYSSHLLGFVTKGDKTEIDLNFVGNCQILRQIIEENF